MSIRCIIINIYTCTAECNVCIGIHTVILCVYICACVCMHVWILKLLNVITAATAVSFVIELYASPILMS